MTNLIVEIDSDIMIVKLNRPRVPFTAHAARGSPPACGGGERADGVVHHRAGRSGD